MRFASVEVQGKSGWGAVEQDQVLLWSDAARYRGKTLREALAAGPLLSPELAEMRAVPFDMLAWKPVIPDPGKILCVGINYETHRRETRRDPAAHPTFFVRFADSQIGHGEPMRVPRVSNCLDYEAELAVIVGRAGRAIPASDAARHIAGFACYNDGSVRDWQRHTTQWTPGKNFPGTGSFGPWMVTPDEFGPFAGKRIRSRLNGEVRQDAALDEMIFKVAELFEYASTFTALSCGDVLVTGTPGGVGSMRDPPSFMQPGDRIEIEIDGIGTLLNPVAFAALS
jgi:2-keto-4-pentenoate hydratase/2-oxohepta-3-ene-1,7-dioic acid hydratase in catechol pathway